MLWEKIRAVVMFGIACITSPCFTPLIVPLVLVLLAGTPAALWISQNVGWVYGGLTLISAISLIFGVRWMRQKSSRAIAQQSAAPIVHEANV